MIFDIENAKVVNRTVVPSEEDIENKVMSIILEDGTRLSTRSKHWMADIKIGDRVNAKLFQCTSLLQYIEIVK